MTEQGPPVASGNTALDAIAASGDFSQTHSGIEVEQALTALVAAVREHHGEAVQAVLFYGSCLRSGDPALGIADFYVLVDDYRHAGLSWLSAGLNRLLPPNVFYLETHLQGHTLRAKYAVVSLSQFMDGVSGGWFLSYLWGRFAQPSQISWTQTSAIAEQLVLALTAARGHFLRTASAALSGEFDTTGLWQQALHMSYRTELRAERQEKIRALVQADPAYYSEVTPAIMAELPWCHVLAPERYQLVPGKVRQRRAALVWLVRRGSGKLVSVARLFKSLFTFSGAVDYALWKIQRHSGQAVEIKSWERRYPWFGGWFVLWRLWRRGQLR